MLRNPGKLALAFGVVTIFSACSKDESQSLATVAAQKPITQQSEQIHQGYSDTADQYEVNGVVVSNVDVAAPFWNANGKSDELIQQRATLMVEYIENTRTAEERAADAPIRQKYKDAISINAVMPGAANIAGYTSESYRKAVKRNQDAGYTLMSGSVYNFPANEMVPVEDTTELSVEIVEEMGLVIAHSVADIYQAKKDGKMAVIFNTQGADFAIEDMSRIATLESMGVKSMNFVYNANNALAGGMNKQDMGVTELGKKFIEVANNNGVIVDVSHSSNQTAIDAAKWSKKPIMASHSNAATLHDIKRNLSDEAIKAVGASNGVVCNTAVGAFLNAENDASPEAMAKHIVYTAKLIGKDKTCYSTDYVHVLYDFLVKFLPNTELYDPAAGFGGFTENQVAEDIWGVVAVLETDYGWTEEEIRGFLGENLIRVYKANWK